ncbi:helix-turn-helix domain-containing protein [Paenibacillus spongiae]|uniref:Helix-turn-helix domain-containing protein n=1 Tax=Paenibacillus spongiae TaxID=2909671 RepID=A0ABY5S7Z6_9BACL|nr:helix-turn-helix domain-containing protein [Paenibacillus spongiae]UVI30031.1 helix-turn-helix domain-containing protein [Paenibacillus spongiae]
MDDKPRNRVLEQTPAPPPGALVSGYTNEPYGFYGYRSWGTKDWLVMFTLSGEGCVRNDDLLQYCRSGDLIILQPGTPHDYFTPEGSHWEMMWAHFIPRSSWMSWINLPKLSKGLLFIHVRDPVVQERMRTAFSNLIADNQAMNHPLREELGLNSLEEIMLLATSLHSDSKHKLDPRIHEVLNLISHNIKEPYSIRDLAQHVCLSPSRLAHLFKEQTGDSILEFLLKMRLRQAAKLLEFTSRNITQIAADVGFHSPDYFTRKFSQYTGMTPSMFRNKSLDRTGSNEDGDPFLG